MDFSGIENIMYSYQANFHHIHYCNMTIVHLILLKWTWSLSLETNRFCAKSNIFVRINVAIVPLCKKNFVFLPFSFTLHTSLDSNHCNKHWPLFSDIVINHFLKCNAYFSVHSSGLETIVIAAERGHNCFYGWACCERWKYKGDQKALVSFITHYKRGRKRRRRLSVKSHYIVSCNVGLPSPATRHIS